MSGLLNRNRCPTDLPPLSGSAPEYNSALPQTLPRFQAAEPAHRHHHPSAQTWHSESVFRDLDSGATRQLRLCLCVTPSAGGSARAGHGPSLCCKWSLKSCLTVLSSMTASGVVLLTTLATPLSTPQVSV